MNPTPQSSSPYSHPETFRLPRSGERDPYFGLTRSFYYASEAAGTLRLIRIKKRGSQRGITLIPYHDVLALIAKNDAQAAAVSTTSTEQR